jgi:uncharacterized iron-regulated membrane protein
MSTAVAKSVTRADIVAWGLSALALGFILKLRLLPALLAGLLAWSRRRVKASAPSNDAG